MHTDGSRTSGWGWRRGLLILGTSALLAACGGGGGNGGTGDDDQTPDPDPSAPEPTVIEGSASAPASGVAYFEPRSPFQVALEFFIPPAAAAITGLEPVGGATVELIRIDDSGDQIGDVLASTTTSTTGDYTLTVPEGVSLAGNLVLRIQGLGGVQMRAQAVVEEVDITPVSEFVLRKFIDNGTDLENLTTSTVVDLSGRVEEFDLTAGSDLSEMLDRLEAETGEFVDARIYAVQSAPGDGSSVAGSYHMTQIGFHLDDADDVAAGSVGIDIDSLQGLTLSDGGSGEVDFAISGEESVDASLSQNDGDFSLRHETEIDTETESFSVPLTEDGVVSIESTFEEEIEGDYGWRRPPGVIRLQKARDANLMVALIEEAEVRYRTTDTNGDGTPDALDPNQREGDEVYRGLIIAMEKLEEATAADLAGDYGRVALSVDLTNAGDAVLEVERNKLTFHSSGTVDAGAGTYHAVGTNGYASAGFEAAAGIPISIGEDGDILTLDGNNVDGFVGADGSMLVLNQASATDDADTSDELYLDARFETSLAVKLPLAMLTLQERAYRAYFLGVEVDGSAIGVTNTRFDSLLRVTSPSTGELDLSSSYLRKESIMAEIVAESDVAAGLPVEISLAADGAMSITLSDEEGTFAAEGYMNHEGSFGVFHSVYNDAGAAPTEVGLVVLVEVTE